MERVECVVVGAGVVGLAVARALAQRGHEVVVLEAADRIGTGCSARNSEVVHAGLYYPTGSLKARLCVAGNRALYAYCAARGVAHRRCGKLIVATSEAQRAALVALHAQALANGVADVEWLSADEARAVEPQLRCVAALRSPSTGIVDTHGLMRALYADAAAAGADFAFESRVTRARVTTRGLELFVSSAEETTLLAERVFNCAGLSALAVARLFAESRPGALPPAPQRLAKGSYFALSCAAPFSHLVYPLPAPGGLGVHLTLDLAGRARFGPDVEWVERESYEVDPRRADGFYAEVREYWPALPDDSLTPAYAGIRPKLHGPEAPAGDFVLLREDAHGVPGLVSLLGIESPGLTACLALAEAVIG